MRKNLNFTLILLLVICFSFGVAQAEDRKIENLPENRIEKINTDEEKLLLNKAVLYVELIIPKLSQTWNYNDAKKYLHLLNGDHPREEEWEEMVLPFKHRGQVISVENINITNWDFSNKGKSASINKYVIGYTDLLFKKDERITVKFTLYSRGTPWQLADIIVEKIE